MSCLLNNRVNEFSEVLTQTKSTNQSQTLFQTESAIELAMNELLKNRDFGGSVYLIGNGGSAGVASHSLTDFLNVGKLRAFTLHDPSLITCMANDFGYEKAFALILETVLQPNDILIAISSSGNSLNICNAAKKASEKGGFVITLTGFKENNPLRQLGDINFWLDSSNYGIVEIGHQFILHNISDRIGLENKKIRQKLDTEQGVESY